MTNCSWNAVLRTTGIKGRAIKVFPLRVGVTLVGAAAVGVEVGVGVGEK